jgi:hypothetical protein
MLLAHKSDITQGQYLVREILRSHRVPIGTVCPYNSVRIGFKCIIF